MGLLFSPRGGSAFVVRYLSPALTKEGWSVSLAVGGVEFVTKIGLYWLHERIWDRVPQGKRGVRSEEDERGA